MTNENSADMPHSTLYMTCTACNGFGPSCMKCEGSGMMVVENGHPPIPSKSIARRIAHQDPAALAEENAGLREDLASVERWRDLFEQQREDAYGNCRDRERELDRAWDAQARMRERAEKAARERDEENAKLREKLTSRIDRHDTDGKALMRERRTTAELREKLAAAERDKNHIIDTGLRHLTEEMALKQAAVVRAEKADALLLKLEWKGHDYWGINPCPQCGGEKESGHNPDCELAAHLAQHGEVQP